MVFDLNVAVGDMHDALGLGTGLDSDSEDLPHISVDNMADDEAISVSRTRPEGSDIILSDGHVGTAKNDDPVDERPENNQDIIVALEKKLEEGVSFGSLDQAYLFYCEYGRQKGFSVRRADQRYVGKTRSVRWKDFVCHCAGKPYSGAEKEEVPEYRKMVTRTQCTAKIRVYPMGDDIWKNMLFMKEHNHLLLSPDQTYLLRSSRILSESRVGLVQSMNSVGIPVHVACGFMEVECGGPHNVGYLKKDVYDKLRKLNKHKRLENADSASLLDFFNGKTNTEPYFFWKVCRDNEGHLKHFFFRDSRCLSDFELFGDIVSIDTTHKTNKYNLRCAPFVGINHHSINIMFGVGFLSDETTETFEWLLQAFLESMNGKMPNVVFTDQCQALMNAVDSIFPRATHRLCQWHVNNNATKHFGSLNHNEEFKRMWHRCMNRVESEADFESLWAEMMAKHVSADHTWLREMYALRHRWAAVFTQKIFTAGLLSTSRSEGTHKVLKSMIRNSSSLHEFACAYEKIQSRWRELERAEDAACLRLPGQFVRKNTMMTQAATMYTRAIFKKFEYQCTDGYNVDVEWLQSRDIGNGNIQFKATRSQYPNAKPRTIIFNRTTNHAHCSCHMWEGHGYFCRHILKVFQVMNVSRIPDEFILKRWTKNARGSSSSEQLLLLRTPNTGLVNFLEYTSLVMRSHYEMVLASKASTAAHNYLLDRLKETKKGLDEILAKQHTTTYDAPHVSSPGVQFLDPLVVQDRRLSSVRDKDKTPNSAKRACRSKCPGISPRSRKRSRNTDFSSSQPADFSKFRGDGGQEPRASNDTWHFFVSLV